MQQQEEEDESQGQNMRQFGDEQQMESHENMMREANEMND